MCTCKNKRQPNNNQQSRRVLLPKIPPRALPAIPPTDPNLQLAEADQDTLTGERRRIEKLRRDAVRRSLGIA